MSEYNRRFEDNVVVDGVLLRDYLKHMHTLRPADEWCEENGDVLWWHLPIEEYPIVGSHAGMGTSDRYGKPTDCRRLQEEGWLTHWSPLPNCAMLVASDGKEIE